MGYPPYGLIAALVIGVLVFAVAAGPKLAAEQIDDAMASWVGRAESELVAVWGLPTAVLDDGRGGTIIVYQHERTYSTPSTSSTQVWVNPYGGTVSGTTWTSPSSTYSLESHRTFYVDSTGRISGYAWRGTAAPAYQAP